MAVSMAIFFCVAVAVTILLTVALSLIVAFHFPMLCVPFLVTMTVPHVSE